MPSSTTDDHTDVKPDSRFAKCSHGIGSGHQHGNGICPGPCVGAPAVDQRRYERNRFYRLGVVDTLSGKGLNPSHGQWTGGQQADYDDGERDAKGVTVVDVSNPLRWHPPTAATR